MKKNRWNKEPAKTLPEGWIWTHCDDLSGGLESPESVTVVMYDLSTGELKLGNKWTFWKDYPDPMNLQDAIAEGEQFVRKKWSNNGI